MNPVRISAVSYLNTKPLLFGLLKSSIAESLQLELDIPSRCAAKLKNGEVDLALVPVAVLPEVPEARIVTDYCIGAEREVRTVAIYAHQPLEQLQRIYLDYHSRTSVELVRILLQDYWQLQPELLPAFPGYESEIGGTTGGLIIGDRAIAMEHQFPYRYDLAEAWYAHSGLPFVFAVWVAVKPLGPVFLRRFNEALRSGVESIPQLKYLISPNVEGFDLERYFTHNISYVLDAPKRQALDKFLTRLQFSLAAGKEQTSVAI